MNEFYASGCNKLKLEDFRGALKDFDKAFHKGSRDTKIYDIHFARATANFFSKNLNTAIADSTKAISLNKIHGESFYIRGLANYYSRNYDNCIQDLNNAAKYIYHMNKPNVSGVVFKSSGNILVENYIKLLLQNSFGVLDDAFGVLDDVNPTNSLKYKFNDIAGTLYFYRGKAKARIQQIEDAIVDYNLALQYDDSNALIYFERGNAKYSKNGPKDYNGAYQDFNVVIKLESKNAIAYFNRGNASKNLGDLTNAIEDWKKAFSLGYKPAMDTLGKYL